MVHRPAEHQPRQLRSRRRRSASAPISTRSRRTADASRRTSTSLHEPGSYCHRPAFRRQSRRSIRRFATPGLVRQPALRRHHRGSTRPARSSSSAAPSPTDYTVARDAAAAFYARLRELFAAEEEHHDVRPLLAGAGRGDEAHRDRGHLPRRLGDVREGLDHRGSRSRPRELPAEPGARRGRGARPRAAHRRPQPAVPALAHDREAAGRDAGRRLPAVHHRRRRHRPRRRPARPQPHPPLRRGRRPRLPHRGPEPRHEEVRPPGRQGARGLATSRSSGSTPRASSSTSCASPGSSSRAPTPRRPTSSTAAATSATSRSSSARPTSTCRPTRPLPRADAALLRLRRRASSTATCSTRSPTTSIARPTPGSSAPGWRRSRRGRGAARSKAGGDARSTRLLDKVASTAHRRVGGGGRPRDLRRSRRRGARVPRRRGRALEMTRRGVARASRAARRSTRRARRRRRLGVHIVWDCEHAKTPEGYYQVRGGIEYAIAKSLAAAPFADLLWMETKTANLHEAREFADAIHARVPGQDARLQPLAVVQLGLDGHERRRDAPLPRGARASWASSSTSSPTAATRSTASRPRSSPPRCRQDGMLALARLQRKFRLRRVAVPHAADAGGRPAPRRGARRVVGPHGDDEGDGQGLDAAPAPRPDRGAEEAARGVAGALGRAQRHRRADAGRAAAAPRGLGAARAGARGERATRSSPTSSSRRSTTAAAAASSRCATRTRSTRRCARSA